MLTNELIELINETTQRDSESFTDVTGLLSARLRGPHFFINTAAQNCTRRISIAESPLGRYAVAVRKDGSSCHVWRLRLNQVPVQEYESLRDLIETAGGSCHTEQDNIVIQLPPDSGVDIEIVQRMFGVAVMRVSAETPDLALQSAV